MEQFPHPECSRIHERRTRKMRSGYEKKLKAEHQDYESLVKEKQEVDAEILSLRADLERKERQLELAAARKKTVSDERILQGIDVISQHVTNTMSRKKRKKILHRLADPQVLIEKKLMAAMAKKFGLTGKAAKNTNTDIQRDMKKKELADFIIAFVEDAEFTWLCPGKKEKVTLFAKDEADGVKKVVQKRVLLMDAKEIHASYRNRAPAKYQCQYDHFSRVLRKCKWIIPLRQHTVECCLCKTHQNYALLLKSIHSFAPFVPMNPDSLFKEYTKSALEKELRDTTGSLNQGYTYNDLPNEISFKRWQLTPVLLCKKKVNDTVWVNKLRPADCTLSKSDFIEELIKDFDTTKNHSDRAKHQHRQVRQQREQLGDYDCTIQMDFAQNWLIGFGEGGEIQSVFFNKDGITVHPVVLHVKVDGKIVSKCLCYVSDDRKHDAGTISYIMKRVCDYIKDNYPHIKIVHYWTDSPSSQYRNISIYSLVCRHHELFLLDATWNYFETNHGKGPCDGVGAAAKRKADYKVKKGNDIYSAQLFVEHCNDSGTVEYDCMSMKNTFAARGRLPFIVSPKSVRGSMTVHSVAVTARSEKICTRATSCFDECCWDRENRSPRLDSDCASTPVRSQWTEFLLYDYEIMLRLGELETEKLEAAEHAQREAEQQKAAKDTRRARAQAIKRGEIPEETIPEETEEPAATEEVQAEAEQVNARYVEDTSDVHHDCVRQELFERGSYVAAVWGNSWFIAEVTSERLARGYYNLNFMRPGFRSGASWNKNIKLSWPKLSDEEEISEADIICPVASPYSISNSRSRNLVLSHEEFQSVQALYEVRLDGRPQLPQRKNRAR